MQSILKTQMGRDTVVSDTLASPNPYFLCYIPSRCPVKIFCHKIFLLPVVLPVSTVLCMRRHGYITYRKYFILHNIQHIVESY